MILSGVFSIFCRSFAFLPPSSASESRRILLIAKIAVSEHEKNAESKRHTAKRINCVELSGSKDKITPNNTSATGRLYPVDAYRKPFLPKSYASFYLINANMSIGARLLSGIAKWQSPFAI